MFGAVGGTVKETIKVVKGAVQARKAAALNSDNFKSGLQLFSEESQPVRPSSTNTGRQGKQARLREIVNDDKVSSALRGEIKRDINAIQRGTRKTIRVPEGYNLAHKRGCEAWKGYGYEYSDLQIIKSHRTQHKFDNFGK